MQSIPPGHHHSKPDYALAPLHPGVGDVEGGDDSDIRVGGGGGGAAHQQQLYHTRREQQQQQHHQRHFDVGEDDSYDDDDDDDEAPFALLRPSTRSGDPCRRFCTWLRAPKIGHSYVLLRTPGSLRTSKLLLIVGPHWIGVV
jgi:hypothetical protein